MRSPLQHALTGSFCVCDRLQAVLARQIERARPDVEKEERSVRAGEKWIVAHPTFRRRSERTFDFRLRLQQSPQVLKSDAFCETQPDDGRDVARRRRLLKSGLVVREGFGVPAAPVAG